MVAPKNESEQEIIKNFLKSSGISGFTVSVRLKKYLAGLEMVEIGERHPKLEISDEEILYMLKEGEEQVYGKYRKEGNN